MPTTGNRARNSGGSRKETTELLLNALEELNDKIGLMVDVIEKHPRSGVPNSMYFSRDRNLPYDELKNFNPTYAKDFMDLTSEEMSKLKDKVVNDFLSAYSALDASAKNYRDAALSASDENLKRFYEEQAIKKENEKQSLSTQKANFDELMSLTKLYESETDEAAKSRLAAIIEEKEAAMDLTKLLKKEQEKRRAEIEESLKKIGKTPEQIEKYLKDLEGYKERTKERQDVSSMIAHSGFGNTKLGRGAQKLLSARQQADDISNFGGYLKNGGAEKMSKSLFGNGAAAKGATKALGGLGSMLTKFAGPIAAVSLAFDLAKAAVETFVKMVNIANEYISRNIKQQTNLNQLAFTKQLELSDAEHKTNIENIKYLGDMSLKGVEVFGETIKQGAEISSKKLIAATEIATGVLMNGINETAYSAAEKNLEIQADIAKFEKATELRLGKYGTYSQRRDVEREVTLANLAEEKKVAAAKYEKDAFLSAVNTQLEQEKDWKGLLLNSEPAQFGADVLSATPGSGVSFFHGTPKEAKVERDVTEEMSKGQNLPGGVTSESRREVLNRNKDEWGTVNTVVRQPFFGGTGYKLSADIAEQIAQMPYFAAEWSQKTTQWAGDVATTTAAIQENLANKQLELAKEVADIEINTNLQLRKTFLELAKKTEKWVEEFDKMSNDLGINIGYTTKEQLNEYQNSLLSTLENTVSKFGKDREDMIKMQQGYVENTGRQKLLSESDYGQLFGLGKYLGDDGLAAQFASEMEIFNAGAEESVDLLDDTLQNVNRIGLNGRKYAKEITNNLKMAQKYNFKGGTKGFMEMAKWAEKTRFNISSLGGMLDKVQEGGLEGVIQMSAGFQVLGGHSAMNSDPLGMLFDAWGDPESYAKRMQDMTKGFGTVDSKTGETKFNINESMQMAQIAKLQGRSVEEVRGEVMDRNRRDAVINSLSQEQKNNLSQDDIDYLGSLAQYNRKTGQFEVKVKEGNEYVARSVNEISPEDLKNVMPEKHEERMEVYMQNVLSLLEGVSAEEISQRANMAAATYEAIINEYAERTRVAHEAYAQNRDKYIEEIKAGSQLATSSFHDFVGVFEQGNSDLSEAEEKIKKQVDSFSAAINDLVSAIKQSSSKIYNAEPYQGNPIVKNENNRGREYGWLGRMASILSLVSPTHGLIGYAGDAYYKKTHPINDGIVSGGGESMTIAAQNVIPIDDGLVAMTSENDSALVKEPNGEVDKWLNGIGSEVRGLRKSFIASQGERDSVTPDHSRIDKELSVNPYEYVNGLKGFSADNTTVSNKKQDVNLSINGSLKLDCGNQQIDLGELLRRDPYLVRQITEFVINQMSRNENGGKYEMHSQRYYR